MKEIEIEKREKGIIGKWREKERKHKWKKEKTRTKKK